MLWLLLTIPSYMLGSFLGAYHLFKRKTREDIRDYGSGNPGTANIWAELGAKYGLTTFAIDSTKAAVPVLVAFFFGAPYVVALACGVSAIVGHCFPFYLGFRGGKGIASTVGACFASMIYFGWLWPFLIFLVGLITFCVVFRLTKWVSLGSLAMMDAVTLVICCLPVSWVVKGEAALLTVLITWRHKDNIRRMLSGEEKRFHERAG